MSGIAGIYHFGQELVNPTYLEKMSASLYHRGPDKQGVWHDQNIGLVSLLLQTTPESLTEELPFYDSESETAITADARIDNRSELLALLDCSNLDPKTISDSRLILEAYKKWGVECPKHLLGDFAVVIWDKREQRLFAFRDHFGVKPFYYFTSEKLFAFASEIKALHLLPQIPRGINEEKIADFMAVQEDNRSTFFQGISILPAAHCLLSTNGTMKEHRYWELIPGPLLKLRDNQEYTEAFKEIFFESVRCRLRRTGSIGSHMSGGLDSSSISCAARDILLAEGREQLHTFSLYFKDLPQCDERQYFNAIIQQGGITPHLMQADQYPSKKEYDEQQETFEEATAAFNTNPVWILNNCAQQQGVKILLDGFGGDSTVSHGTDRLTELARSMRLFTLIREAEGYARHFQIPPSKLTFFYLRRHSPLSPLFENAAKIKQRLSVWRTGQNSTRKTETTLLSPALSARVNAAKRRLEVARPFPQKKHGEQNWHYQQLTDPSLTKVLELIDRCSAHFSIEKRFPFFDKRLITFCLALPAEQKLDHGWNRVVMRRAMESSLPPEVCWRGGKADLGPHADLFATTLIKHYQLQNEQKIAETSQYLDITKIKPLLNNFTLAFKNEPSSLSLYRTVGCMIWLHNFKKISG